MFIFNLRINSQNPNTFNVYREPKILLRSDFDLNNKIEIDFFLLKFKDALLIRSQPKLKFSENFEYFPMGYKFEKSICKMLRILFSYILYNTKK